jgi:hypothetical protein
LQEWGKILNKEKYEESKSKEEKKRVKKEEEEEEDVFIVRSRSRSKENKTDKKSRKKEDRSRSSSPDVKRNSFAASTLNRTCCPFKIFFASVCRLCDDPFPSFGTLMLRIQNSIHVRPLWSRAM